jgi:hypothetical protein
MPRYFFNIRDDQGIVRDEEGMDLPDLQSAREEAQDSARELLAETVRSRQPIDHKRIEVVDEGGTVVENIKFRDLLY